MTVTDFLIGVTLVNGLPHFTLGLWGGNMLSLFGFGNKQNMAYGILNLISSVTVYLFTYGIEHLIENGVYVGGLTVVVLYIILGKFWRDFANRKVDHESKQN